MTIFQAYQYAKTALQSAGIEDYAFESRQILRFVTGYTSSQILQSYDSQLLEAQEDVLVDLIRRRYQRYPLQYLLGFWSFFGLELSVGEGVLIPRSDTETLVETALEFLQGTKCARVIDLCAGCGCVALAIAQNAPDAEVTALEKYPQALRFLRRNVETYGNRVRILQADLADKPADGEYDLITCNPPYIPTDELHHLQPEIGFEPESALNGGKDGLDFYRLLCKVWVPRLRPGGRIVVEIGQGQDADVKALFAQAGLQQIAHRDDLSGIHRVIYGTASAPKH